jgi:hypothetical protein
MTVKSLALEVPPEEREVVSVAFNRQSVPVAFAITERAVYFLEQNKWSFRASWRTERVPIEKVTGVFVRRMRTGMVVVFSALLILGGAAASFVQMLQIRESGSGRVWIGTFVMMGAGVALPFLARQRTYRVEFIDRKPYIWKPPMLIPDMTKHHIAYLMGQLTKGFRSLRIRVTVD